MPLIRKFLATLEEEKRNLPDLRELSVLSRLLCRPLSIGNHVIDSRLVLAPMAMLGHVAFRELLAQFGGFGLLFSEMCGAKRLIHENRHVSAYFRWRDEELSRLVCQIVGADPDTMAAAARRIEREGFFGVDINFGCTASDICRLNGGAAVLKNPLLAVRIVSAVRQAVSIPLFVKFRTGWTDDPDFAVDLAKRLEAVGADALTFHPRVAPDRRAHPPKWEYIGRIKEAVSIPVFGNGNVFDATDCLRMLQDTGCDGVAIGRMAVAKPWIFAEWTKDRKPEKNAFRDTALRLAHLLEVHYDPPNALRRFRKFSLYFAANFQFGHSFYTGILKAKNMVDAQAAVHRFFCSEPALVTRPNINFFR
jgi:nifR3 family TIM-barrel protein